VLLANCQEQATQSFVRAWIRTVSKVVRNMISHHFIIHEVGANLFSEGNTGLLLGLAIIHGTKWDKISENYHKIAQK
jgi:hypothetical protein